MSVIISNASPLIALCSIDRLQILEKLRKEIVIPKAAAENNKIKGAKRRCVCNMLAWHQKK